MNKESDNIAFVQTVVNIPDDWERTDRAVQFELMYPTWGVNCGSRMKSPSFYS